MFLMWKGRVVNGCRTESIQRTGSVFLTVWLCCQLSWPNRQSSGSEFICWIIWNSTNGTNKGGLNPPVPVSSYLYKKALARATEPHCQLFVVCIGHMGFTRQGDVKLKHLDAAVSSEVLFQPLGGTGCLSHLTSLSTRRRNHLAQLKQPWGYPEYTRSVWYLSISDFKFMPWSS